MNNKELEVFLQTLQEKNKQIRLHANELYTLAQECERIAFILQSQELLDISKRLWSAVKVAESLSIF